MSDTGQVLENGSTIYECRSCAAGYTNAPGDPYVNEYSQEYQYQTVCDDIDECATGTDNCSADATCTNTAGSFTCDSDPPAEPPNLTVVKHVVIDSGGSESAEDFIITVTSEPPADPNYFPGSEDGTEITLEAGDFIVEEAHVIGYATSYSDNCSGTIVNGDEWTCTVTNDDYVPTREAEDWSPQGKSKKHDDEAAGDLPLPVEFGGYTVADAGDVENVLGDLKKMKCSSKKPDELGCLAAELLAAKLNVANGADPCADEAISAADDFLISIGYDGPRGKYRLSLSEKSTAIGLANPLARYNSGIACP